MPKIRRISIVTLDPERLARFYEDVFEMRRIPNPKGEALYLTDGYFNLTLVPNRAEGKPNGLNHFGFEVEDEAAIAEKFNKWNLKPPTGRPGKRSYADLRGTDPDGNNFDISGRGFPT
jgi:catechol 2,3-dioxygenase-like lactoylglutathione lyase family enzyme